MKGLDVIGQDQVRLQNLLDELQKLLSFRLDVLPSDFLTYAEQGQTDRAKVLNETLGQGGQQEL